MRKGELLTLKLKLRTIPRYKKQDTNKLQIAPNSKRPLSLPRHHRSNRAANDLSR